LAHRAFNKICFNTVCPEDHEQILPIFIGNSLGGKYDLLSLSTSVLYTRKMMVALRHNFIFLISFFGMIFSLQTFAIGFEDMVFGELVPTARAYGLGNAYLNKVDDAWASFYNPAGLGTVRAASFHLGNFHMEGNKGSLDVLGGPAEDYPEKISNLLDVADTYNILLNNPGTLIQNRGAIYPNFTMRYFSLGYMYSVQRRATLETVTSPYEYAFRRDHGPVMATNLSLMGGIFKIGASAVYINRKELVKDFPASTPISINDSDYRNGDMLYVTGAAKLSLPMFALPSLSLVVRNTSADDFSGAVTERPDRIRQQVDMAFSFTPQIGTMSRIHMEVVYRDLHRAYPEIDSKRRVAAGIEIDYARSIFVRAGYGDSYGSFGIGVRSRSVIVDLASYAVDTTNGSWRGKEDRRFAMTLSSGM
jgi:hypothetical protein